jgi:aspartate ammonia-lyase
MFSACLTDSLFKRQAIATRPVSAATAALIAILRGQGIGLIQIAFPTAIKEAVIFSLKEFGNVLKMGRTENQDAVPMTLGQEFGAYAVMIHTAMAALARSVEELHEINMGATAIAKEALATGGSVYDLVLQKGWLTKKKLDDLLSPANMTDPRQLPT